VLSGAWGALGFQLRLLLPLLENLPLEDRGSAQGDDIESDLAPVKCCCTLHEGFGGIGGIERTQRDRLIILIKGLVVPLLSIHKDNIGRQWVRSFRDCY